MLVCAGQSLDVFILALPVIDQFTYDKFGLS